MGIALFWGVALILLAAAVPVYEAESQTSSTTSPDVVTHDSLTLVEESGAGILFVIVVPLLVTIIAGCVLWIRDERAGAGTIAWTLAGLLVVFNLATMLSIGVAILPVTGCLVVVCILRELIPPATPGTPAL
jgi:hypothetical protein